MTRSHQHHLHTFGLLYVSLVACLLIVGVAGCHPPASVVTPAGKAAYSADQVVQRLGELENAAIQANKTGGLTDRDAVRIVQFCVESAKTLKAVPEGWVPSVSTAWHALKRDVPVLSTSTWTPYASVVDAMLASFGG